MRDFDTTPSPPTLRRLVQSLGTFAFLGGIVSFLGWATDTPWLTDWFRHGISIQPNAAVAVTCAGAALVLATRGYRRAVLGFGIVVGVLGLTALLQYVTGTNLELVNTTLMFGRTWGRGGVMAPGRMGPPGALCWTLIGTALVLLARGSPTARRWVPPLALVTVGVAMLAITGYLYGATMFYSTPHLTVIALQTATFILVVSAGLIACVHEYGPTLLLRDESTAGLIARRVTPLIVAVAFIVGLLRMVGQNAGLFDLATGTAARTIAEIVLLLGLLAWSLVTIRRHDASLRASRRMIADDLTATARLQDLSTRPVHPADLNELLREILSASADLTGTDKGNIQLYDPTTGRLRIIVHQGLGPRLVEHFADRGWAATCDAAAEKSERVILEDVVRATAFQGTVELEIVLEDDIRAIQSTPLISRDGRLLGMLNNHYRTPRRPPERELRYIDVLARMAADLIERCQNEEALREGDRHKDEFLATLGHELRAPLAPLRNTLEIMHRIGGGTDVQRQGWDTMSRHVAHLARLVDDLIDVSRITHNKIELRKLRVEIAPIVHQALEGCHPLATKADLRVRVNAPRDPIYVHADPVRLAQVFGNLLNNACKYTEAGGSIWVDIEREGNDVVVRVKDTGVGIPRDQLDRVFELFTQINVPFERTQGGLGIGLTLVKRLVEMHDGSVTVQSEGTGRGSEFTVRLPALVEKSAEHRVIRNESLV